MHARSFLQDSPSLYLPPYTPTHKMVVQLQSVEQLVSVLHRGAVIILLKEGRMLVIQSSQACFFRLQLSFRWSWSRIHLVHQHFSIKCLFIALMKLCYSFFFFCGVPVSCSAPHLSATSYNGGNTLHN